MYIGFLNFYDVYNNNRMLEDPSSTIGDDGSFCLFYLGQQLKAMGHKICTIDKEKDLSSFDAIIFIDFPTLNNPYFNKLIKNNFKNLYLIILEPIMTKPDNWKIENHKYFRKIFTWHDEYIDNQKYFKINYSFDIPKIVQFNAKNKEKLCTLISCNKYATNPIELYGERLRAIRWFEKNHPEDFDLYGIGWAKYIFKRQLIGLNKYLLLRNIIRISRPSYRGAVLNKNKILEKYKFSICYENEKDVPGYVTEKIFDCFFAGCVPIYLGAPNIENHIPPNTFIDKRKFDHYEDLYSYISGISEIEYTKYIDAIENFIKSNKIYSFSADFFANTIIKEVLKDIDV